MDTRPKHDPTNNSLCFTVFIITVLPFFVGKKITIISIWNDNFSNENVRVIYGQSLVNQYLFIGGEFW